MNEAETRGRANRALVEKSAYGEARAEVRADLIERWIATRPGDDELREHLWRAVKTLDMVSQALENAISGGSVLDRSAAVRDILAAK